MAVRPAGVWVGIGVPEFRFELTIVSVKGESSGGVVVSIVWAAWIQLVIRNNTSRDNIDFFINEHSIIVSETPTQLKLVIEHSRLIDNRWVHINLFLPLKVNRECTC